MPCGLKKKEEGKGREKYYYLFCTSAFKMHARSSIALFIWNDFLWDDWQRSQFLIRNLFMVGFYYSFKKSFLCLSLFVFMRQKTAMNDFAFFIKFICLSSFQNWERWLEIILKRHRLYGVPLLQLLLNERLNYIFCHKELNYKELHFISYEKGLSWDVSFKNNFEN